MHLQPAGPCHSSQGAAGNLSIHWSLLRSLGRAREELDSSLPHAVPHSGLQWPPPPSAGPSLWAHLEAPHVVLSGYSQPVRHAVPPSEPTGPLRDHRKPGVSVWSGLVCSPQLPLAPRVTLALRVMLAPCLLLPPPCLLPPHLLSSSRHCARSSFAVLCIWWPTLRSRAPLDPPLPGSCRKDFGNEDPEAGPAP